jgi:hypothetical protein
MNEQNSGFGKFIPGFDFLQNLAKGASQSVPQMPNLSNWVAPTLNLDELDKRIGELKAVRFWLEQNSVALAATIQALEVQKMTLATLKGMNFNMGEVADALKLKTPPDLPATAAKPEPANAASPPGLPAADRPGLARQKRKGKEEPAAAVVDPLQWWGALTQQFQQIATNAMQDAAAAAAAAPAAGGGAAPATGGSAKRGPTTGAGSVRNKAAPAKRSTRKAAAR